MARIRYLRALPHAEMWNGVYHNLYILSNPHCFKISKCKINATRTALLDISLWKYLWPSCFNDHVKWIKVRVSGFCKGVCRGDSRLWGILQILIRQWRKPTLETNKQTNIQMQLQRGFGSIVNQIVLVLAGTGKKRRSVRPTLWLYWSLASSFSFVLCVMRVTPKTGLNSTKLEYIHIAYLPQRSHSHQLYML